jgi:hypothetical protein
MGRLIFDSMSVYGSSAYDSGNLVATISGITVEGLEITKEANSVEIENGLMLHESYSGSITVRTIKTQTDASEDILSSNASVALYNYISKNGSVAPNVSYIQLDAAASAVQNVRMNDVYLMGYEDYANGRVETVLSATKVTAGQGVIDATNV